MLLKLSEKEILLLKAVCFSTCNAGGIARLLGVKESFVSRILRSLEEKALISVTKNGVQKLVSLSNASHALAFKQLFALRQKSDVEHWLSGNALDVLVVAGFRDGASLNFLAKECSCSSPTIYRVVKKLKSAGVVAERNKLLFVSDEGVKNFANYFADNIQQQMTKGGLKGYSVSYRVRKHVIVRTDAENFPAFFTLTGLNALREKGLEFINTSYSDYYFNLGGIKRALSVEECFIHALFLTTLPQHQDAPLLAKFLKNYGKKLDFRKLSELAKDYAMSSELEQLRRAVSIAEKLGD